MIIVALGALLVAGAAPPQDASRYAGHSTQQFVDDATLTATPRPPEPMPRI